MKLKALSAVTIFSGTSIGRKQRNVAGSYVFLLRRRFFYVDYGVVLVVVGSSLGVDLTPLCIDMRTLLCYHSNIHPSAYSLSAKHGGAKCYCIIYGTGIPFMPPTV